MYWFTSFTLVVAYLSSPLVGAFSQSSSELVERQAASSWLASQGAAGQGAVPSNPGYKVFRNVKDYGAVGDGKTDDSAAINKAIQDGARCGPGCNSSTITPALVFFPSGTYLVKNPIIQWYYTQLIGDASSIPTIKADSSIKAMGVIDSDPYDNNGNSFWVNQNNFYRQVRNFKIDLTSAPDGLAGIHWQVAQATSLQNIEFNMRDKSSKQIGIFMDNGSGGFMADLTFNGGQYGAFFGNQQFTTRNLKFSNCDTAIFMNWNWLWTLKNIQVDATCGVAVNMSVGGPTSQTVGSVLLQDSKISSPIGVVTAYDKTAKASNGTLIIDNVDFTGCGKAVENTDDGSGAANLVGGSVVASWIQGSTYTTGEQANAASNGQAQTQGTLNAASKPKSMLKNSIFAEQSKRQYESGFTVVSVKSSGAKGDGVTDDTVALQAVLDAATPTQVIYFPHGNYLLKNTLKITKSVNIVGEVWPILMADGASFNDQSNPKVVIQVGDENSSNINVQMSDLVISTNGPAQGAILMEWNTKGDGTPGANGLWDVHWRIGGYAGSNLQSDKCSRADAGQPQTVSQNCFGAFLLFHMTEKSSAYLENVWWWVADHELDNKDGNQLNIYNGRGVLIEAADGPTWLYGTASEHSQLYNYAFNKASNIYSGAMQTETAYMHGGANGPLADVAFKPNTKYADPTFSECKATDLTCKMTWGLRITESSNVLVYGAGLYSFFNNYGQKCLSSGGGSDNCQSNMVYIDDCSSDVVLYGLSTKAAVNMVTINGEPAVFGANNPSTFCETVALVEAA